MSKEIEQTEVVLSYKVELEVVVSLAKEEVLEVFELSENITLTGEPARLISELEASPEQTKAAILIAEQVEWPTSSFKSSGLQDTEDFKLYGFTDKPANE